MGGARIIRLAAYQDLSGGATVRLGTGVERPDAGSFAWLFGGTGPRLRLQGTAVGPLQPGQEGVEGKAQVSKSSFYCGTLRV